MESDERHVTGDGKIKSEETQSTSISQMSLEGFGGHKPPLQGQVIRSGEGAPVPRLGGSLRVEEESENAFVFLDRRSDRIRLCPAIGAKDKEEVGGPFDR
jgi:hypothetical protein